MSAVYERYGGFDTILCPNGHPVFWIGVREGMSTPMPVPRRSTECFSPMPVLLAGDTLVFECGDALYVVPDDEMRFVHGLDAQDMPDERQDMPERENGREIIPASTPERYSCEQMPLPRPPMRPQPKRRAPEEILADIIDGIIAIESETVPEWRDAARSRVRYVKPEDNPAGTQLNLFNEAEKVPPSRKAGPKATRSPRPTQESLSQGYLASVFC